MPAPVLSGPQYLREGLKLVLSPGLRLFVLLPLLINLVLFVGLIYFAGHQFSLWVDTLMPSLPSWLSFLNFRPSRRYCGPERTGAGIEHSEQRKTGRP